MLWGTELGYALHAKTLPRALPKAYEVSVQPLTIDGAALQPALGAEDLGLREDGGVHENKVRRLRNGCLGNDNV